MDNFWSGFEKRALSPQLLHRASEIAKGKAQAARAGSGSMLDKVTQYGKKMKQSNKFHTAAIKKEIDENFKKGHKDLVDKLQVMHLEDMDKLFKR